MRRGDNRVSPVPTAAWRRTRADHGSSGLMRPNGCPANHNVSGKLEASPDVRMRRTTTQAGPGCDGGFDRRQTAYPNGTRQSSTGDAEGSIHADGTESETRGH